jgi:hypothetical protein
MKLLELLTQLDKNTLVHEDLIIMDNCITATPAYLKLKEKELFNCDEFKNVARINYIDLPSYFTDEETGEPISNNREFLGGKTIVKTVSDYEVGPKEEIRFGKIVDLHSITLQKKFLASEDITKPGVWIYPTDYSIDDFNPINQIRVIWEPKQLEEVLALMGKSETVKERLMRMFENALDNMESNIPCEYSLIIKCSERSVTSVYYPTDSLTNGLINSAPLQE